MLSGSPNPDPISKMSFPHPFPDLSRVVERWVKITRFSARFELRFESLKRNSVLILFVHKLMIGSSKNNRENYPRKCF